MQTWPAPCPQPARGPPPQPRPRRRKVQWLQRGWPLVERGCVWSPQCCLCTHGAWLGPHPSSRWHTGGCRAATVTVTERFSLAGKSKKEDGVKEEKRKRDSSTQPPKSSKPSAGGKSSQQPTTPQQAPPGQPQQGAFMAHKEIKLTLLNKVRPRALLVGAPGNAAPQGRPAAGSHFPPEIETKWGPASGLCAFAPACPPALVDSLVGSRGMCGHGVDESPSHVLGDQVSRAVRALPVPEDVHPRPFSMCLGPASPQSSTGTDSRAHLPSAS